MALGMKGRILTLFLVCFLLNMIILTLLTVYGNERQRIARQTANNNLAKAHIISNIERSFGSLVHAWKNILLRGQDPEKFKKYLGELNQLAEKTREEVRNLRKLDSERTHEKHLIEFEESFVTMLNRYQSAQTQFLNPPLFFKPAEADAAVKGVDRQVLQGIAKIVNELQERSHENEQEAEATSQRLLQYSLASSALFAALFSWIFSHFLIRITRSLGLVAERLHTSSEQVTHASSQLAQSSHRLSASVTEQAATMQEILVTVDGISAMVNRNASSTLDSQKLSAESRKSAMAGRQHMQAMIGSINAISQSNDETIKELTESNQEFSEIVKVIEQIGDRARVINDIVFQTRLLSFNASVESARAGEHGRGFAVVADEVGKLAQVTGSAAQEISAMLESSIHKVRDVVAHTQTKLDHLLAVGKHRIETGTKTALDCASALERIATFTEDLDKLVTSIAEASSKQALGIEEITQAMAQLEHTAQQNATVAEETSAAGGQLRSESDALRSLVNGLIGIIEVRRRTRAPADDAAMEPMNEFSDDEDQPLRKAG